VSGLSLAARRAPQWGLVLLGGAALVFASLWVASERKRAAAGRTDGGFALVSAGGSHSCAVDRNAVVECWGHNPLRRSVPQARFVSVAAGGNYSCGLHPDGRIQCWGGNLLGEASPPSGRFKQIAVGWHHGCGVMFDDTLRCWGGHPDHPPTPPKGAFRQVSVGFMHSCAVRLDGAVLCWGRNDQGQAQAPIVARAGAR